MKRKKSGGGTTDLRSFLERAAAKKKQHDTENATPSTMPANESEMQLVTFQGHSGSGTGTEAPEGSKPMSKEPPEGPEPVKDEQEQPQITEDDDESLSVYEAEYSDEDCESVASNTRDYKAKFLARLTWSLKCIRFLLHQGLAFHGHDETNDSSNVENFRELLEWLAGNFDEVNQLVLENAPHNCLMIDHKIQKQLIASCAHETTKFVIDELGDECFAILANGSSDAYQQEQLAIYLRFVNKKGEPVERFLGLVCVEDTTALTLKKAIQSLLIKVQLPLSKVRGQGYDGSSNMKSHINGLKKLIMDESPSAYYVHCFAHQLQPTLLAVVAKDNMDCLWFLMQLAYLLNVLGMPCKKIRMLRIAQAEYMIKALRLGEIEIEQGLNQEMVLARPCDTRWGSHYRAVMHVIALYPSIRKVLIRVGKECK